MIIIIVILLIIIVLLGWQLFVIKIEHQQTIEQVKVIRNGSGISLTTHSNHGDYIELINQINALLIDYQYLMDTRAYSYQQMQETITSLTHDIRTPLTSALGYIQLFDKENLSSDQRRYLETVEQRLKRLADLLDELFLFAKVIDREYELETESLDLSTLITEAVLSNYDLFEAYELDPIVEVDSFFVVTSKEMLNRCLDNIINNAVIHGVGDIEIIQQSNEIIISNKVEGTVDSERIFDRFYKADRARSIDSSGLGLSTVKAIIDILQGSIEAACEDNVFSIKITL